MEGTLRDEIDGAIQKLCSIACQSERDIKVARDTLRRIAMRTRDGEPQADYAPLVERVMARLMGERKGDDWFMKHRLLETIPTFVNRGEKFVIVGCAAMLKHDNWMIRAAATEALGHLMTRGDVSLPHCASRPGTRTNSRPASPGSSALRPPNVSEKQRAQNGLVIDENYGTDHAKMRSVGKRGHVEREKTPATTVYDDGSIANDDRRSQFLGDDDDARTNVSRVRSERSMASSVARSHVRGGGESGAAILDRTGSGGALEAVQEESRLQTAVSEGTRREMSGALQLSDLENALAADAVEEDDDEMDWDDVMEELLPLIQEALESEEPEIRRNAVMALRKCVTIGDLQAMPLIRRAMEDSDWMCREAAMLALRELALPGDVEATEIVCTMLQDARREVRTAALKALETVARPGDPELVSKLITIKEYSRKWAELTKRPGWEIREAGCLAIGVVADLDCQEGIASLKKSLTDERIDVQRAATYAMGQVAERVVPEDMVWTYNNMTAQPAVKSSWQNLRWNVLRQAYVPNGYKMPIDPQMKHSPRECIQALTKTPRGSAIPHLLLTPRQEHLYEEDQIQEVLRLREEKRRDGEKKKIVLEIADKIKAAIERHDIEEVERLQEQLKQFEETVEEASESDEEQSMKRSTRTKSLASFEDFGSDVGSEDTRSQVSFESFNDAKSAVSFSKSAVSFGVTRSRVI